MSYDGIKNQLISRLGALGYRESQQAFDFEDASAREYGNTFIITALSGEMETGESENLNTRFYDNQLWSIQIAIEKSNRNQVVQKDELNRKINAIIKDLDNPDNWEGVTNGARNQRYQSWEFTSFDSYYLVTILLDITDTVTY